MSTFGNNVRKLRLQLQLTIEQLADKAGVDPSNLSKIERGLGGYSRESVERIAKALQVSLGVLFAEDGEDSVALLGRRKVPILDEEHVRVFISHAYRSPISPSIEHLLMDIKDSPRVVALHVKGDSMIPEFRNNDLIVIDPDIKPNPGDFVVADRPDMGLVIRQYRLLSYNSEGKPVVELAALNPSFPGFRSDVLPFTIIGTVIEHRRRWR